MTELLTTSQLVDKLGVNRRTLLRWSKVSDFPGIKKQGMKQGGMTNVYFWPDIREWLIKYQRWDALVELPTGFESFLSTHCRNGLHEMTDDNLYFDQSGHRRCRECILIRHRAEAKCS